MGYLIPNDYLKQIQDANLQQIISSNTNILSSVEDAAVAEAISFLKQKFDTDAEFTDISNFSLHATYTGGSRWVFDFPAFDAAATYTTGALASVGTAQYICQTPNGPAAFNATQWVPLGQQYDLSFVQFPYPLFNVNQYYKPGDRVYWNGSVYQCQTPSVFAGHEEKLQARVQTNIPLPNTFPGTDNESAQQWGPGTPYSFQPDQAGTVNFSNAPNWSSGATYAQGQLVSYNLAPYLWLSAGPSNTGNTPGADIINWLPLNTGADNRDRQLLQKIVDIALYHLHARIAPRNIPELRLARYMGLDKDRALNSGGIVYPVYSALGWLQACARGEITPGLPLLQPRQGSRIRYGGNVKNINSY